MSKLEYLKCPICKTFELKDHPESSSQLSVIFNYMLKCGHCGYSVDKQVHYEGVDKCLDFLKNPKKD